MKRIDFPRAAGTFASGIDDRGRIVGSYTDERDTPATQSEHGFLLDRRGRFRTIDVSGATQTRPAAISERGQIAGEYVDRAGISHGYLQEPDGSVRTIDAPDAGTTVVADVDDRGRVVGVSVDVQQTAITAFVREPDGRFTPIVHPDAGFYGTQPDGINNAGQITGSYFDTNDRKHGFVLDDGVYTTVDAPDAPGRRDRSGEVTTIDVPGAVQTRVRGINNRGQIAIDTVDRQLRHHSFLFDRGRFIEIRPRGAPTGSLATDVDDHARLLGYVL